MDAGVLEAFYDRTSSAAYALATCMLGEDEPAADLVVAAYRQSFESDDDSENHLLLRVRNLAAADLRRRRADGQPCDSYRPEHGTPCADALDRLTQRERTLIQLAYFDGFHTQELATRYSTSSTNIARELSRSMKLLGELLRTGPGGSTQNRTHSAHST